MNIRPEIMIVSVFQKNSTYRLNLDRHNETIDFLKLKNIPHLELHGRYEGIEERSILIEGFKHRSLVEDLAKTFKQECYLESHNDRATFLVFPYGKTKFIGTLVPVSEVEAKALGNYSWNPVSDQYFVTK